MQNFVVSRSILKFQHLNDLLNIVRCRHVFTHLYTRQWQWDLFHTWDQQQSNR